jgi:glutathione S-transferase
MKLYDFLPSGNRYKVRLAPHRRHRPIMYAHVDSDGEFDPGPYPAIRNWLARIAGEPGHIPITFPAG